MEMWQRFSGDAKRAVIRAQEVAREMRSSEIAPEHLALGIIEIGEGSGFEMLRRMGVNLERVREALVAAAQVGESAPPDELAFSDHAQRCLQQAYVEWQKRAAATLGRGGDDIPGYLHLESVHLLLGLLAPASRCECRTLISHGVFYGEVSELLRRGQ